MSDPGDPTRACIDGPEFIPVAARREIAAGRRAAMTITDKSCPGDGIMARMREIASGAKRWRAPTGVNNAAGASSGLDWSFGA